MIEVVVRHVAAGLPREERSAAAWALVARLLHDAAHLPAHVADTSAVVRACRRCGSREHGKPELAGALAAGWHVSVSTTDGRVAAAVSDEGPVGVDVESVEAAGRPETADAALHPAERGLVTAPRDLAVTWSRKEALLKATGDGLALDPRRVLLSLPSHEPQVRVWPDRPTDPVTDAVPGFVLRDVDAGPGYVAAVAVVSGVRVAVDPAVRT